MSEPEKVRLDKWLWAARFFKTRSMATDAVSGGKVHVDGARVKPARQISVGQTLEIQKGPVQFVVQIEQLISKRVSAPQAQKAYTESPQSIEKRQEIQTRLRDERRFAHSEIPVGRPSKRDRRQLHRFKTRQDDA